MRSSCCRQQQRLAKKEQEADADSLVWTAVADIMDRQGEILWVITQDSLDDGDLLKDITLGGAGGGTCPQERVNVN